MLTLVKMDVVFLVAIQLNDLLAVLVNKIDAVKHTNIVFHVVCSQIRCVMT